MGCLACVRAHVHDGVLKNIGYYQLLSIVVVAVVSFFFMKTSCYFINWAQRIKQERKQSSRHGQIGKIGVKLAYIAVVQTTLRLEVC